METNNLVFDFEGIMVTSTRKVSNDFNKDHSEVLKKIHGYERQGVHTDGILDQFEPSVNTLRYFIPNEYIDSKGESRREYLLTRDGFALLVMGFTGAEALNWKIKYIDAFNYMEDKIKRLSLEENKEYKKVLLCAYGNVYPLNQAVDVINTINSDCNIRTTGELVGYLKDDKLLLNNNKISSLGYKNRFLVIVDGKICLSEKCIRRITTRGTNIKATTVMSEAKGINNLEDKQIAFSIKEFEEVL